MNSSDVACVIDEITVTDDPAQLRQLHRRLEREWPKDHDADVLRRVAAAKAKRLRFSN